jgi:dihydrofolate reductase
MIKAILACDEAGGIGLNGSMPWPHNSRDLKWFKECTSGHVVVMGSNTWNSVGIPKPLPNRINYVFSSKKENFDGAEKVFCDDPCRCIASMASQHRDLIVWIIGGAKLINQCWPIIDEFYLSRIPGDYSCDTKIDLAQLDSFFLVREEEHPEVTFQIYKQIKVKFP